MFFAVPVRVEDKSPRPIFPWVNLCLLAANVLIFWLGWSDGWKTGPGTRLTSVFTYAFAHGDVPHLIGNMWFLLVFGNVVNRRLGNGYYLAAYLGSAVAVGMFARVFCHGYLVGASGAIFAVIAICLILMPAKKIRIFYFALFPFSLLAGLFSRPKDWMYWFIRCDHLDLRALWAIFLVPLLELWGLYWSGSPWTHLSHLLGIVCGVTAVLLLPSAITMRSPQPAFEM